MNKIAVVFGAGGGIGNATCQALSAEYYVVAITRKEIDLSDSLSYNKIGSLLEAVQPDLVVNCAGHFANNTETYNTTMDINFGSNWCIIKHYIDKLSPKPVKVVVVGSSAYREGRKKYMLYAASKAALYNLWLSAAEYFADTNVSVSIVNPVKTKTKMMDKNAARYIMPEDVAQAILSCAKDINSTCIDLNYKE